MAQNGQSTRSKGDLRPRLADSDSPVAQQDQAKDRNQADLTQTKRPGFINRGRGDV
jgi:hypothetical protein